MQKASSPIYDAIRGRICLHGTNSVGTKVTLSTCPTRHRRNRMSWKTACMSRRCARNGGRWGQFGTIRPSSASSNKRSDKVVYISTRSRRPGSLQEVSVFLEICTGMIIRQMSVVHCLLFACLPWLCEGLLASASLPLFQLCACPTWKELTDFNVRNTSQNSQLLEYPNFPCRCIPRTCIHGIQKRITTVSK
jgi:hypothetical protein